MSKPTDGQPPMDIERVTETAQKSVHGFLTNIAKGVRRTMDEGGRGTRRRVETYTSHTAVANDYAVESADEWDEYDVDVVDGDTPHGTSVSHSESVVAATHAEQPAATQIEAENEIAARRSRRLQDVYRISFSITLTCVNGIQIRRSIARLTSKHWKSLQSKYPKMCESVDNIKHVIQSPDTACSSSHQACWIDISSGSSSPVSKAIQLLIQAVSDIAVIDGDHSSSVEEFFTELVSSSVIKASPLLVAVLFVGMAQQAGLYSRIVSSFDPKDYEPSHPQDMDVGGKRNRDGSSARQEGVQVLYWWAEVYCPFRQSIISVNPVPGYQPRWDAPYAFAFGLGPPAVVDVTARYTGAFHNITSRRLDAQCGSLKHVVWPDTFRKGKDYLLPPTLTPLSYLLQISIAMPTKRPRVTPKIVEWYRSSMRARPRGGSHLPPTIPHAATITRSTREPIQLSKLLYSSPVPTTLKALKGHPLYVVERDLKRHEGIYPKDKTTIVGTIRGEYIYKRTAIASLRSADGWLRESRSLIPQSMPYKVSAPPPSRPLSRPSNFYGYWQTVQFEPLPPQGEPGALYLPRHNNTNWYILLGSAPPEGIVIVPLQNAAAVARKISVDFRLAVLGFTREDGGTNFRTAYGNRYTPVIDGVVVLAENEEKLVRAHREYIAVKEEQNRRRTSQRARNMWMHFCQRLVATARLEQMFNQGL